MLIFGSDTYLSFKEPEESQEHVKHGTLVCDCVFFKLRNQQFRHGARMVLTNEMRFTIKACFERRGGMACDLLPSFLTLSGPNEMVYQPDAEQSVYQPDAKP